MKKLGLLPAVAALLLFAAPEPAQAVQSKFTNPDCNIICSPVLLTQNMVQVVNLVDPVTLAEIGEGGDVDIEERFFFTARVTAAFPTQFKPLILFFDVQWQPFLRPIVSYNADGSFETADEGFANPVLFVYGTVWRLIGGGEGAGLIPVTSKYYTLDIVPLFVYAPAGARDAKSTYNHIFTPELDQYFHIGKVIDPKNNAPFINQTSIHFFIDYLWEPFDPEVAQFSRWVFSLGLTTPLAPLP